MSNGSMLAERVLAARFGASAPSRGIDLVEECVVITISGTEGKRALATFEKEAGPLLGRTAGMFRPCRMERSVGADLGIFLFSMPSEIVPRARLRVRQRWICDGFGYAVVSADASEFRWVGEEPEGKVSRGISMDAYQPPQLPSEWTELLISKEQDASPPSEPPRESLKTIPVSVAEPVISPLSPSVAPASPRPIGKLPRAFSLRAEGPAGKRSLAQFEKRFGKLPAQLKFGSAQQQTFVFPVTPDGAAAAVAAQGEIATGLFLVPEAVFAPSSGLARSATSWLNNVLKAAKK